MWRSVYSCLLFLTKSPQQTSEGGLHYIVLTRIRFFQGHVIAVPIAIPPSKIFALPFPSLFMWSIWALGQYHSKLEENEQGSWRCCTVGEVAFESSSINWRHNIVGLFRRIEKMGAKMKSIIQGSNTIEYSEVSEKQGSKLTPSYVVELPALFCQQAWPAHHNAFNRLTCSESRNYRNKLIRGRELGSNAL